MFVSLDVKWSFRFKRKRESFICHIVGKLHCCRITDTRIRICAAKEIKCVKYSKNLTMQEKKKHKKGGSCTSGYDTVIKYITTSKYHI